MKEKKKRRNVKAPKGSSARATEKRTVKVPCTGAQSWHVSPGFADRHPTPITSNQTSGAATSTITGKHPKVICTSLLSYANAQFRIEGFKFQFIVHDKINEELTLNRLADPFTQLPL